MHYNSNKSINKVFSNNMNINKIVNDVFQSPLGFATVTVSAPGMPAGNQLFGMPVGMNPWKGKPPGLRFFLADPASAGATGAAVACACPPGTGTNADKLSGFSRLAGLQPNGAPLLLLPPRNDDGSKGSF
jgi:hypothetical protein